MDIAKDPRRPKPRPRRRTRGRRDHSASSRRRRWHKGLRALRAAAACGAVLSCSAGDDPSAPPPGPRAAAPRPTVASQTLLSDEILWDLGPSARRHVVAVSALADDARYAARPGLWPPEVPRVRTGGETLATLAPDLAVVATFTAPAVRERLDRLGVETVMLPDLVSTEAYRRSVALLAGRIGLPEAGRALVQRFDEALAPHRRAPGPTPPTILSYADGVVAGAHTTFAEIASHTGWRNAAAARGLTGHRRVDPERLLAWDPDVVVVPCTPDCPRARRRFSSAPGFHALRAVRTGHVIPVPAPILHATGAALVDLAAHLASARDGFDTPPARAPGPPSPSPSVSAPLEGPRGTP